MTETQASRVAAQAQAPDHRGQDEGEGTLELAPEVGQGKISKRPEVPSLWWEHPKYVVISCTGYASQLFAGLFSSHLRSYVFVTNILSQPTTVSWPFYSPLAQFDILGYTFKWHWMVSGMLFLAYFLSKQNSTLYIWPHCSEENLPLSELKTVIEKRNWKNLSHDLFNSKFNMINTRKLIMRYFMFSSVPSSKLNVFYLRLCWFRLAALQGLHSHIPGDHSTYRVAQVQSPGRHSINLGSWDGNLHKNDLGTIPTADEGKWLSIVRFWSYNARG